MNRIALAVVVAGCSTVELPSTTPPPSWGVPISGGNLLVTKDGTRAVIADPDRDRLLAVDLATSTATEIPLTAGDEPGRLVEDGAGRVHVALRRGGALVTLDGAQLTRRAVCAEPRGVAWDPTTDTIVVACTSGELVSLPAAGGDPTRVVHLDRDLRDVIVVGNHLVVTRFRSAELLTLDDQGAVTSRVRPPDVQRLGGGGGMTNGGLVPAVAAVAWRTIALPNGSLLEIHQRQLQTILMETHGGYGQGCSGPVEDALTTGVPGGALTAIRPPIGGPLPVDVAASPTDGTIAVAVAGSKNVQVITAAALAAPDDGNCEGGLGGSGGGGPPPTPGSGSGSGSGGGIPGGAIVLDDQLGAPTSVAFAPTGELFVYYPELPALVIHSGSSARTITLPGELGYDSGRAMFHARTPSGLACASCHPEGRDDGLVWNFAQIGKRRTQNLAGQILARAPYHWAGDMADLPTLMDDVFSIRMAGDLPTKSQHAMLGPWLNRVPAPAPGVPGDPAAISRGQALFQSGDLGCVTCHGGPLMSTKALVNVGTGGTFKVPSLLGVGARAPYLHDGCAATLADRFGPCGGGDQHGRTSQLNPLQRADLVTYLESL